VGLFKKPNARLHPVRNASARQFKLEFHRVIVRAVNDGDVFQARAVVAKFEYPRCDECRLLVDVRAGNQAGFMSRERFTAFSNLRELPLVAGDRLFARPRISGVER